MMFLREMAELRTILLLVICYSTIALLVFNPPNLPLVLQMILLIPFITLHSSLQHECIHGHPFRKSWINDLLAMLPMGLFLSYYRFKDAHLKHHNNQIICDPEEDPESSYLTEENWSKLSGWYQSVLVLNNTLLGRMLLGPAISVIGFILRDFTKGNAKVRLLWLLHFTLAGAYLWGLHLWANVPIWAYFVCSYFGYSLLTIRTFLEHQAHPSILARTVIIERKGFFSFLFLNNNFHAVHHAHPNLAWYRIPALFERNRARFLGKNKGYYFKSYGEVFTRFLIKGKEPVIYPLSRDANS